MKKGGVVSIVDVYGPTDNLVPIGNLMNKGITMRGNQTSVKRLLPRLIEYVPAGRLNPRGIITHRVPLEEVADAYHIFSTGLDECTKSVLIPSSARAQSHSQWKLPRKTTCTSRTGARTPPLTTTLPTR